MEKAYSGDLIKITKAFDEPYRIGDILEVDMRDSDMGASDDNVLMTTEGYYVNDGDYTIFKPAVRVVGHYTNEQLDRVKSLYKRACKMQSTAPYELYDATEIQAIQSVCSILKINLE